MTESLSHPRDRILDAAYAVFEERGVQTGTMSDIAERARVGRATLYRYFPGKDLVVEAVVLREARQLLEILSEYLGVSDDPGSLLERGLLKALRYLKAHTLLQRVLRDEPDSILPFLTINSAPLLEAAVEFAAPYIERAVKAERMAPVDPRVAAEWAARVLLSLLLTPSVTIDLDDPGSLEDFVAGIGSLVGTQGGPS
jgi:AcrR family transcriptional regulator